MKILSVNDIRRPATGRKRAAPRSHESGAGQRSGSAKALVPVTHAPTNKRAGHSPIRARAPFLAQLAMQYDDVTVERRIRLERREIAASAYARRLVAHGGHRQSGRCNFTT